MEEMSFAINHKIDYYPKDYRGSYYEPSVPNALKLSVPRPSAGKKRRAADRSDHYSPDGHLILEGDYYSPGYKAPKKDHYLSLIHI